jgi:zinc protease
MQFWFVAHGSDARWQPPTADEVRATRLEDVKARMQDALKDGPVEVIVAGDISVEDALKGLQSTFGALSKRRVRTAPTVGDERQPRAQELPIILRYQGSGDQGIASIAWRTTSVFPDVQAVRTQQVLERLLAQRLFDELRTHEGMTYTPQTQTADSMATPGWGIIRVFASIPTARIPDFYAAVAKTIADLKAKEVPADELERARGPIVHDLQIAQQNDGYWLASLADAQIDPRRLELIRTHLADFQKVTPADVQRAAQTYLLDSRAWKLLVLPPDKVAAPGAK